MLIEALIHQGNDVPIPESPVIVEGIAEKVFFEQIHEGNQEVEPEVEGTSVATGLAAWRRTRADVTEEIESSCASKKNVGKRQGATIS